MICGAFCYFNLSFTIFIMLLYFGADHRGFNLKAALVEYVKSQGYEAVDMGAATYDEQDDYPVFAAAVAKKVSMDPERSRGIVLCGSGAGVDIVANKFDGVRSALAISPDEIYDARHDDNANVLAIAADFTSEDDAKKIVQIFLETAFSGEERFARRIGEIREIESEN